MDHRSKQLEKKRVGELKRLLRLRKVDYSDCVEKADLIRRVLITDKEESKPQNVAKDLKSKLNLGSGNKGRNANRGRNKPRRAAGKLGKKKTRKDLAKEYLHMGIKCKNDGNRDQAMTYYRKGLDNNDQDPVLWYNLGVCFAEEGKMSDARDAYLKAVKYEPNFCYAQNNLGAYFKDHGDLDKAVYHYKMALEADPKFATALNNLSVTYHVMGLLGEGQQACEKAIQLNPKSAEAFNNLGTLYLDGGRVKDAVRAFSKCIDLDPEQSFGKFDAFHNRLLAMNSLPAPDEEKLTKKDEDVYNQASWDAHNDWAMEFEEMYDEMRYKTWDNDTNPHRILRVGYLSSDLRRHPVSYFIEGPLKHMDQTKVESFCYMNGHNGDERTSELREFVPEERWRKLGNMSLLEVCELIRRDEIDILIELGGHSSGSRLDVMVLKPAPVQVTWIGYPNTTGLTAIDYRIIDSMSDPEHTKQQHSETLLRMPEPCAFLQYTGSPDAPKISDTPALKNGYLTFGCLNTLGKITDQGFDLWCRVLKALPKSRIFFKCKPFRSEITRREWMAKFKKKGIKADRITLRGHVKSRNEHLEILTKNIDIQLDPFPYGGTTTSCESIWMGVPVLTLHRRVLPIHAQNVGVSLFSRVPDLKKGFIAKTKREYIDIAVGWSKKIKELNKMRRQLRKNIKKSPLGDGPAFCKVLAGVFSDMWEEYCQKQKEALFDMD